MTAKGSRQRSPTPPPSPERNYAQQCQNSVEDGMQSRALPQASVMLSHNNFWLQVQK
ncbi:hypothetical protein CCUG60885_03731 [Mycobacteroides salmoniphilum]|uniref:Uncharacterized protein n=1 Tax=Mycobacteroides salmoniphilum TaxID=404941 RepID=A0A4R8SD38_9MYCO|nr:hypothetical protein CCUG60885_03731 [Mycobacteroides salmoniphilum]TEA07817.1 hypothetical protein CCUG60883_00881 [Mycobacteroides salmoniphilum]